MNRRLDPSSAVPRNVDLNSALQPGVHQPHTHDHGPVRNVNEIADEQITMGQRTADLVAVVVGSWPFMILQSILLVAWAGLNLTGWVRHWDPYPFILMNLFLSLQAAYTAPVIMMSQHRMAARDRIEAHNDYLVNQKAEKEVRTILANLAAHQEALNLILEHLAQPRDGTPEQP
jgi:uncharacterized membrane protein